MTDLTKLRDELMNKAHDEGRIGESVGIVIGFNALHSHLTEAAGEFDEKAWRDMPDLPKYMQHAAREGARLQFEQDRARIGLAEYNQEMMRELKAAKTKQLEARLAESERLRADYEHECETIKEMKDKLTAAEARIKDLENRVLYYKERARGG